MMRRLLPLMIALSACSDPALQDRVAALEAEVTGLKASVEALKAGAPARPEAPVIVGKEAMLEPKEWLQGTTTLADHDATLLVFFETWCPHCKREVPKLEQTYKDYGAKGLGVVGVTRLTRGVTPEVFNAFVEEHSITYPLALDDGKMGEHYNITGVPAAVLLKGGKVVWTGNPATLSTNMIETTLL